MVTLQAPVTPRTLGNRENARSRRQHSKRVFVMDAAAIALAMCGTYLLMFGIGESFLDWKQDLRLPYAPVLLVLGIVWFLALQGSVTRRRPTAPAGLEEYVQILSVALKVFGAIAIVSFLLQAHPSRLFFLAALPAGTMLLCLGRVVNRRILDRRRRQGLDFERAVLVGTEVGAAGTFLDVQGHPGSGLCITDVAIVGPDNDVSELRHLPRRTLDDIAESARRGEIDAVLVAPGLAPARVRSLSWALEKSNVNFLLAPSLMGVTGSRIHPRPFPGLTLMEVDLPRFSGVQQFAKRMLDVVFSSIALILLSPLLAAIAIAIKCDSKGPAVFRQQRIGLNGEPFTIHKFRTMRVDAEAQIDALIAANGGSALRFKLREDPRVTRLGAFLRRTSLDELLQFWDVLRGPMSVVGPRPQVSREVAEYDDVMHRRLLVKPGITGLWQVNGRSDLSPEQSKLLDIFYVENWSVSEDVVIIGKTVKVLLDREGAY